jgi:uncharacterized protein
MNPQAPPLPPTAAWRHLDAREGFEVVFLRSEEEGYQLYGHSTAVEEGEAWGVSYTLAIDPAWATRSAHIVARTAAGARELLLEGDGAGAWLIEGRPAPEIAGCLDVDLEASAFTNALPVRRLGLEVGERADAPAAYVRAVGLGVERLEQRYARLDDDGERSRYDYSAPRFDYRDELVYDRFGLVLDYPGIAVRVM